MTAGARREGAANRIRRRRRLGYGLVAFGTAGLALVIAAAILLFGSLAAIRDAATGFEQQRTELVAMVEPAASALTDAATSASNASASLTRAGDASRQAADLTDRLAGTFDTMASLGSIDIFGARPFAGVAPQFSDVATQSRNLSTDLRSTADALATNVTDSASVASRLQALADRLRALEPTIGAGGDATAAGSMASFVTLAQLVVFGLLAWIAVLALGSIWLGRWFLARSLGVPRNRAREG